MITRRIPLLAVATVAVVLSGCSSSSTPKESAQTTAPASTPAAPVATAPKASAVAPRAVEPRRAPAPRAAAPVAPEPVAAPAAPAAPTSGVLDVTVDVPGAKVFIDRQYVGEAPLKGVPVAPGSHRLNVSAEGLDGISQSFEMDTAPKSLTVRLREVRLNASLPVVHKHRLGSCTGTLIATARGVRYDTTRKDDAFSVSLLEIDTLEVDYLAKNLRLKVKGGKQFDFTDPNGKADNLFVFQRDVDKARQRLKAGDTAAE